MSQGNLYSACPQMNSSSSFSNYGLRVPSILCCLSHTTIHWFQSGFSPHLSIPAIVLSNGLNCLQSLPSLIPAPTASKHSISVKQIVLPQKCLVILILALPLQTHCLFCPVLCLKAEPVWMALGKALAHWLLVQFSQCGALQEKSEVRLCISQLPPCAIDLSQPHP